MDQISKKIKMISEKLKELKNKFNLHKIDGYVVPKNDEYFSEFAKKDKLKTITGFDGSFGTVSYTHLTLPTNREV